MKSPMPSLSTIDLNDLQILGKRGKKLTSLLFSVSLAGNFPSLFPCTVNIASCLCHLHIRLDCVSATHWNHLAMLLCALCDRYGVLCHHNHSALDEICPCYGSSHCLRRYPPFQPRGANTRELKTLFIFNHVSY